MGRWDNRCEKCNHELVLKSRFGHICNKWYLFFGCMCLCGKCIKHNKFGCRLCR